MSDPIEGQLRQAILTIRALKQQVQTLRETSKVAVAVVGIGCRLPAGAHDPDALWRMLMAGQDGIVDVPPDRWDADAWYDADPDVVGKMNTRWGGFVEDIDRFDPAFFELSAREAASMDPQQRLLLEVAWEALEHAAINPDVLKSSATGVFIGINGSDYYQMAMRSPAAIDAHAISGGVASVAAGRLSYLLGLNGPAIAIDTACSSSLSAVHLAVQSLRSGESRVALAGGVYAVLQPNLSVGLSRLHMMAADGRCKSFDAAADGFVQGEGCAVVVLKRLQDAVADHDPILAVIRGSAINQDGRSSSLTAPSRSAQVAVIRAALDDAGIAPGRIGYVEAHGTGTRLGDPIEVHALADALGRTRQRPLLLGALKSNIGHLGPAAGVAGLVKAVLAVERGMVPPNLHLHRLNPDIALDGMPLMFPQQPMAWPAGEGLRAAGVSAFGFSGTNVHVVLEQAPAVLPEPAPSGTWSVLCASARSAAAAGESARRMAEALDESIDLRAASRTSAFGRRAFEFRVAVVARDPAQARAALLSALPVRAATRPRFAVLFGDPLLFDDADIDLVRNARVLSAAFPQLRGVLELAADAVPSLRALFDEKVHGIASGTARIALQWALLEQLWFWKLPTAVSAGLGLGELAAAAASGLLPWTDVLIVIDRCESGTDPARMLAALRPLPAPNRQKTPCVLLDARSGQPLEAISPSWLQERATCASTTESIEKHLAALGCTALFVPGAVPASASGTLLQVQASHGPDPMQAIMQALADLHCHGLSPDWRQILGNGARARLPLYPFERSRYWRNPPAAGEDTPGVSAAACWPPGQRVLSPSQDLQFHLSLGLENLPWLGDHRVHGLAVVPGAFQIACLLGAWQSVHGHGACAIHDLTFSRPLIAPETGSVELWTLLKPDGEAQLSSLTGANWTQYARAQVTNAAAESAAKLDLAELSARCIAPVSPQAWREQLQALGITIGPAFQGIRHVWRAENEALAEVALPSGLATPAGAFHPALFDACLQAAGGALAEHTRSGEALLPVGIDRIVFHAPLLGTLWVHARCTASGDVITTDLTIADASGQVKAVIEGLHVRRAPLELLQDEAGPGLGLSLFHALEWKAAPLGVDNKNGPSGTRLVLAADARTGLDLIARLSGTTLLVTSGDELKQLDANHWQAAHGRLDELISGLGEVSEVIDLQAWQAGAAFNAASPCQAALATAQALTRLVRPPCLWLVTHGAMLDTENPAQAALWGLGATIALEHPLLGCRRLDADSLAAVASELNAEPDAVPETMLLWRDGTRRVARLVQRRPRRVAPPQLRDTVLITGGLGGLGRATAQWAVRRGARQLVLTGRNAAGPEAEAFAQSLGVPVRLLAADLAQAGEAERIVAALRDLPPLRTVVHAAGVQAEGLLADLPWPRFEQALAAKLTGAWALHEATRKLALDHFVLFSSVAALLGAAGQGGYAAANAGLDGLARHRRAAGLPALSVAWGRWDAAGMVAALDDAARRRVDALGVEPMPPELALAALDTALASELIDPMIASIDWDRYRARHPAGQAPRLLAGLGVAGVAAPAARTDFKGMTPAERSLSLLDLLTERFREVLGLHAGHRFDTDRPLVQLGMDSLMAMEIRIRMQRELGQACSIADLLGGASLREIAIGLQSAYEATHEAAQASTAEPDQTQDQWEEFKL